MVIILLCVVAGIVLAVRDFDKEDGFTDKVISIISYTMAFSTKKNRGYTPPLSTPIRVKTGSIICTSIDTDSVRNLSLDSLQDIPTWDPEF